MKSSAAARTARSTDRKSTAPKSGRLPFSSPRPFLALVAEPAPEPCEPCTVSPKPEPPSQVTDPPT
jgi:hypothetical protein